MFKRECIVLICSIVQINIAQSIDSKGYCALVVQCF